MPGRFPNARLNFATVVYPAILLSYFLPLSGSNSGSATTFLTFTKLVGEHVVRRDHDFGPGLEDDAVLLEHPDRHHLDLCRCFHALRVLDHVRFSRRKG